MSLLSTSSIVPAMDTVRSHAECLDLAGRTVEKHINADGLFPSLLELMQINQGNPSVSGLTDWDYNCLNGAGTPAGLSNIKQLTTVNKVPLPPEVVENFRHMQCHCMMGLFTEISRAWLTIDSDIYIWTYEGGSDVAFFEGLGETIVSVGLAKPKKGVFHNFVQHLLILTTTVEIVILGVTFSTTNTGSVRQTEEMNLLPDPVFVIPTDGVAINTIASTADGRIFLGGRDGSLLEIVYQAEGGWFGKRCKKVNHSTSSLSFLVPSFLTVAFSEDDAVCQLVVDDSRHVLYTLSERGTISVWDLGEHGTAASRVTSLSQAAVVQTAVKISRTFDNGMFRPVKSISAIELSESVHLGLVAVTESGVRLYFSTCSVLSPSYRPHTLQMMHIRLPPGFAGGNPPSQRPTKVHTALYSRGTLLLVASPVPDYDTVWCLSSDAYPFHPYLFEEQTCVALEGAVWAAQEVRAARRAAAADTALTPLVVRQHCEPPSKYVVLTAQGAEIFTKLRPVDLLRQMLAEGRGPECDAVRAYFAVQKEDQACATCLVLACNQAAQNAQLADWATRAFFLYGGEPQLGQAQPQLLGPQAQHQLLGQQAQHQLPYTAGNIQPSSPSFVRSFNPGIVSTPYGGQPPVSPTPFTSPPPFSAPPSFSAPPPFSAPPSFSAPPTFSSPPPPHHSIVNFSAKHNGLYLYLGRILRPVWNLRVASLSGDQVSSGASIEDCILILSHLHALSAFLERNTQFCAPPGRGGATGHATATHTAAPHHEAQLEEKRSLDALRVFVCAACETLGLWRVLCEHQLHLVADSLGGEDRNQLLTATFRNLLLNGRQLCTALINSLINRYLDDNASVDAVSARLRQICPNLYRNEDAACSKANEMLLSAKSVKGAEEREEKLRSALEMCQSVAPQINLPVICQSFAASQFYEGVLALCVTCAERLDPKDAAGHYYLNDEPAEDQDGYQAFLRRMECYKEVTNVLDQLLSQSESSGYACNAPASPNDTALPDSNRVVLMDTETQARRLLLTALDSTDELLHAALYDWLMSKQLYTDLIAVDKPSLERYLKKATQRSPDAVQLFDLLWKFHEKRQNHSAAAKILYKLAIREGPGMTLSRRLEYLARAVMCMRSERVGSAPHLGVFLRELEDLLEVARLQRQVADGVARLQPDHAPDAALQRLDSRLMDITELYEGYAEPYRLWESKLAIIHCSGHNDPTLVESIWTNLIEQEFRTCSAAGPVDKMEVVLGKVKEMGKEYALSPRCFPLGFLLRTLELQSCRLQCDTKQVFAAMLDLGVPAVKLLEVYDRLIAAGERAWAEEGDNFHLVRVAIRLIDIFVGNVHAVNPMERRSTVARATDALLSSLTALYSKPDTADLVAQVKGLQSKLERMAH